MNTYTRLTIDGYEEVVRCDNPKEGFTAWAAIHNTHRGPALGGCRLWSYATEQEALTDVLRLAQGMTYKNALARLPLGGGKSVIMADPATIDREAVFLALGEFVESLKGRYITAEDVNSTLSDMEVVKRRTSHVATVGASGNPSPFTAYGVYCAIKASVDFALKRDHLDGLTVAIQGVGETGGRLAELLAKDRCRIIAADINTENLKRLEEKINFTEVDAQAIYDVPCDIFAPCALGGILNKETIPRLLCQIIAGSANNQLLTEKDGERLMRRSILYAPDYVVNAGGVINISCEIGQRYDAAKAWRLTAGIGATLQQIFHAAAKRKLPTNVIANSLAEELFGEVAAAC